MEILLKCLDDVDDLLGVLCLRMRPWLGSALFVIAFGLGVGAVFLFAPPELLAAP